MIEINSARDCQKIQRVKLSRMVLQRQASPKGQK